MKKLFILLLSLLCPLSFGYAIWPFSNLTLDMFNKKVTEIQTELSGIKSEVQGDVSMVKGDVSLMKGRVDKLAEFNTELKLKLEAQAGVLSGVNNSISKMQARDVMQNSNNSSHVVNEGTTLNKLVSTCLNVVSSAYTYIIGLLVGYIKIQSRQLSKQNDQIIKLLTDKEQTYKELVADNNDMYEKQLQSKDEYKSRYFELVSRLVEVQDGNKVQ